MHDMKVRIGFREEREGSEQLLDGNLRSHDFESI
jgi:hypothetical protein